jgi:RTX calcium-binding nonapeptide repeat (4 copies)
MAITVDTLLDENNGNVSVGNISLREAIALSNGGDSINFASSLTGGTIILTQGDLVIDKGLTITGLGADQLTISGNNVSRVFKIDDGQNSASKVVIDGLTIANGFLNESLGSQSRGAGIFNAESLTLTHSVIRDNKALFGGGIDSSGNLSIANSTINNNFATLGGGGISSGGTEGTVHVTAIANSTISGNKTNAEGGGIYNGATSRLIVNSSTIHQNTAALAGGGIASSTVTTSAINGTTGQSINNTIIAGNLDSDSSNGNHPDVSGSFTTTLFNLIGDGTGSTGFTNGTNGNKVGTNTTPIAPQLGSLQNNGGATPTHALLADSPAIDAANPNGNVLVDQRGVARPQGNGFDIGAYEATPPIISNEPPGVGEPPPAIAPQPKRFIGTKKSDVLLGSTDNDVIVGGVGGDVITGNTGADQFVYTGISRRRALADSQISNSPKLTRRRLDQITDFNSLEGDRIKLDFDNNLNTAELPRSIHNVGKVRTPVLPGGGTVQRGRVQAIASAYDDVNPIIPGRQRARVSEAVIVAHKGRTYLSVNDNQARFNPKRDLVIDVTGMNFQSPQDALAGATLLVSQYFI